MGLDMYLSRKVFVGCSVIKLDEHRIGVLTPPVNVGKISYVTEEICYWRKANAIHGWFVHYVQGGKDDCGTYNVGMDMIKQLYLDCKAVLQVKDELMSNRDEVINSKLPITTGYFFGSRYVDNDYWEDIRKTIVALEPIVESDQTNNWGVDYLYESSW